MRPASLPCLDDSLVNSKQVSLREWWWYQITLYDPIGGTYQQDCGLLSESNNDGGILEADLTSS